MGEEYWNSLDIEAIRLKAENLDGAVFVSRGGSFGVSLMYGGGVANIAWDEDLRLLFYDMRGDLFSEPFRKMYGVAIGGTSDKKAYVRKNNSLGDLLLALPIEKEEAIGFIQNCLLLFEEYKDSGHLGV